MSCLQFHPLTITGEIHDSESLIVQGSGSDEIVVCAWDGMTYIVDQQRNSVRFQFEQNVSAFTAGTMYNYCAEREGGRERGPEREGERERERETWLIIRDRSIISMGAIQGCMEKSQEN